MTGTAMYKSNVSREELVEAYRKGVNLVGVDMEKLCQNYEEHTIAEATARRINESIPNTFDEEEFGQGEIWIDEDGFTELWITIAKHGNPAIVLQRIDATAINIG